MPFSRVYCTKSRPKCMGATGKEIPPCQRGKETRWRGDFFDPGGINISRARHTLNQTEQTETNELIARPYLPTYSNIVPMTPSMSEHIIQRAKEQAAEVIPDRHAHPHPTEASTAPHFQPPSLENCNLVKMVAE